MGARWVKAMVAAWALGGCSNNAGSGTAPVADVTPIDTRPIATPEDPGLAPPPRPTSAAAGGPSGPSGPKEEAETPAADFKGTTGPTEKKREGIKPVVLREVRAARNEGYDRLVVEFAGDGVSGYKIDYLKGQATKCGSGDTVPIAGQALLRIRLQPAQAHDDAGKATIKERERKLDLPVMQEMEMTCDFEGQVEWVIGLGKQANYRVLELASPPRIVVDVQH